MVGRLVISIFLVGRLSRGHRLFVMLREKHHERDHSSNRNNHLHKKEPSRWVGWLVPLRARILAHLALSYRPDRRQLSAPVGTGESYVPERLYLGHAAPGPGRVRRAAPPTRHR